MFFILVIVFLILSFVCFIIVNEFDNVKLNSNFEKFSEQSNEQFNIDIDDWEWIPVQVFLRRTKSYSDIDFSGVYIIKNLDTEKVYVGQSVNVIKRLRQHLNGSSSVGNVDINDSIVNGDRLIVYGLRFSDYDFSDLNDMERYFIDYFDAYAFGYNRTKGNKSL